MAETVGLLSRQFGISRRQAYRYVQEAQVIGHAVVIVAPSVPITLKMPANVVRDVRAYSATSGLTISEIVTRAIATFLLAVRGHG
jgi:hypothetical protein